MEVLVREKQRVCVREKGEIFCFGEEVALGFF